jgi:preprotein translocase subunit SecG
MRKRATHWLATLFLALMVGISLVGGAGHPSITHAEEPTPTPTPLDLDGHPGGGGGGH